MASSTYRPWQETWLTPAIWVGLFLLLLLPLIVTSSTIFPFVVGKATYFRALVEVIFALWVIVAFASPRYRIGWSWILAIFALYVVVNLIAAVLGVSFQRSFWGDYRRMGGVFDLIHWFMLLQVLASVVKNTASWRWLLNANLGVSLVLALLGLAQRYDVRVFQDIFWYFETKERLDVTLGNPTYVGAYMLVNILVALAFLAQSFVEQPAPVVTRSERRRRQQSARQEIPYRLLAVRGFWVIVITLDLWVLTLAGTRGALAGLGVGLVFAGLVYGLWGSRSRLRVVVGGATAALVLLTVTFPVWRDSSIYESLAERNVIFERLQNASFLSGSGEARLTTSKIGLEAFASAPLLGWGPGNFIFGFDRYVEADDFGFPIIGDQAHNRVVNELTTTGILGFSIYAALWGRMGWVLFRRIRSDPKSEILAIVLGAALVGYFVQNLFLFDVHATFLQAVLLIGWLASVEVGLYASQAEDVPTSAGPGRLKRRKELQAQRRRGGEAQSLTLPGWLSSDRFQGGAVRWVGSGLLVLLLAGSLYFLVNRPFRAAQLFPTAQVTWQELWTKAGESFRTFPPLATLPRQVLFDTLVTNWDGFAGAGGTEIVGRVQPEERAALQSEPRNARLSLSLGKLYQKASATNPEYLQRAREHVDHAQKYAPEVIEILLLVASQKTLEGDYQGALDMVYKYDPGERRPYHNDWIERRDLAWAGQRAQE